MKRAALALALALTIGYWVSAQQPAPSPGLSTPGMVISGTDIGFRVERIERTVVTGRLVVRVNGTWIDARPPAGPMLLQSKYCHC